MARATGTAHFLFVNQGVAVMMIEVSMGPGLAKGSVRKSGDPPYWRSQRS